MAIHVTDYNNVAMYDSVSGFAFGPTFEDTDDAQSFLQMTEVLGTDDPRKMDDETLSNLYGLWDAVTEAGNGTVNFDGAAARLTDGGRWVEA